MVILSGQKNYGGQEWGETYRGNCVRQTDDGGYIITGLSPQGLWLLKTDKSGDTLWTKAYNTSIGGTGYNVQQTKDGGYIVTGSTESLVATLNNPDRDLWLLKTDSLGDTLWTRKYPGGGSEAIGYCLQQTNDSGFIVVGELNSDVYLLKTDSLGFLCLEESPPTFEGWNVVSSIGPRIVLRYKNCPNGFNGVIFDVSGRKVDEIRGDGNEGAMIWGINQPPGVYFIQALNNRNQLKTAKVVLVR